MCIRDRLSGGTREQLFLAIRFALVREFARRGAELPVVMDDLFVNFDEERTAAAVDCLIEIAGEEQQMLFFTCHQHLAQLFKTKGVEPLFLPGHKVAYDLHKPEDEEAAFIGTEELDHRIHEASTGTSESSEPSLNPNLRFHPDSDALLDDALREEVKEESDKRRISG